MGAIHPAGLTTTGRASLVRLLSVLTQLTATTGDAAYGASDHLAALLAECLDTLRPSFPAPSALLLASEADYARSVLACGEVSCDILDACFDALEDLPAVPDRAAAQLVVEVFSRCSVAEADSEPYVCALRAYVEAALARLEREVLPPGALPQAPLATLADAEVDALVDNLLDCALLFESSLLLGDAFRLRALVPRDVLMRRVSTLLCGEAQSAVAPRAARLLGGYTRLAYADLCAGRTAHHLLLGTLAASGLDAAPAGSDAWWQFLVVLARATLACELARQDDAEAPPFRPAAPPPASPPPTSATPAPEITCNSFGIKTNRDARPAN